MCIGNIKVENANQRYPERKAFCDWNNISCPWFGNKVLLLGNEKSRKETFGIQIGCLSSLPCHILASLMQLVGDRGLRKKKKKFSTSGQSPAPGLGLRTEYKYTAFSGCGTTWKTNHLVIESGLLWTASSVPGPLYWRPLEGWAP